MVKERVPKRAKVPIHDLAKEWDSEESIREYLRADPNRVLFEDHIDICIKHASLPHINSLMGCLLLRCAGVDGHPQPPVRALRQQLHLLYKKASRVNIEEKTLIDDSWHVRKFISLVKMKAGNDPDAYSETESSGDDSTDSDVEIVGHDIEVFESPAHAQSAMVPAARSPSPGSRPIFPRDAQQTCPAEGQQNSEERDLRLGLGNQHPLLAVYTLHHMCGSFP
eukprot:s89_g42.t1